MATTTLQLYGSTARQIKPAVVNLFSNNNNVDRLEFQMENYNQGNVNLSTLDAYAICYGKEFLGGLDEVKLESEVTADGKLKIYWDLTLMSLTQSQTITYQIVFKNDEGQVWTSYKAILFANESLTADEEIVAQYPTILKQMENRIEVKTEEAAQGAVTEITNNMTVEMNNMVQYVNKMADDFDASVVYIPFGENVPVEQRVNNRLYYQYTNGDHTKGRFEDWEGTVLISESTGGGGGGLPMFAPIWSDHLYNDASYLRADNFSWHDSVIYVTAYNKLLEEYNHENSVEMTDGNVTYKLTPDGFKIANANQHDNVRLAYENNGKAWFYLLDVANARFKLPREKKTDGKYLYFYVGYYERPATEVNIGILTEIANGTDINVIVEEINTEVNTIKDQAIAEVQATGLDGLQAQIDSLKAEINTMLGRMDFANVESFTVSSGNDYTCPKDGYINFNSSNSEAVGSYATINGGKVYSAYTIYHSGCSIIPVSQGDVVSVNANFSITVIFIPQKGV